MWRLMLVLAFTAQCTDLCSMLSMRTGCISEFKEKPASDKLSDFEAVSKNATEKDPFEVSMGIYVFKRDVLVSFCVDIAARGEAGQCKSGGRPGISPTSNPLSALCTLQGVVATHLPAVMVSNSILSMTAQC